MKISIIITAWNIENFIEQALSSCMQDGVGPCELLVIDNGSTDRTAELVERFAAGPGSDMDIRLLRHDENLGPGEARNTGLAQAQGDYILFLDGDDWFESGSLAKVRTKLEAERPEVLLFSYIRCYSNGYRGRNYDAGRLNERLEYGLLDMQVLITTFWVPWSKAYRRDFLERIGSRFPRGIYEDVDWTFPILMQTQHISTLPDTVVCYRQRAGSITHSKKPEHFDVFRAWASVLTFLCNNQQARADFGDIIYGQARQAMMHVYLQDRIPKNLRHRYLAEMFTQLKQWRSVLKIQQQDIVIKAYDAGGAAGLHAILLARRILPLGWIKKTVHNVKKLPLKVLRISNKRIREYLYALERMRKPIKTQKVFFESYWGAKADCNPLAIAHALDQRGGYDIVWSFAPTANIPDNFPWRHVKRGSFAMLREAADAGYFVSNTNLHDDIVKRLGTTHLETWHGTPVKLMGLDIRPRNPQEMDWNKFATRTMRWDYMISSNPHSSSAWRRAYPYNYKIIETGYPRNDILFNATSMEILALRKKIGIPEGKKVALYAPTVRDALKGKQLPLEKNIFDIHAVVTALGPDWVLLIRAHYFLKATDGNQESLAIDVSNYPNSNEIALISDLLITDYSSIMFDYACLRRPIVLYHYDYENYHAHRGVYFELSDIPPGAIVSTQSDLLVVLMEKTFESPDNGVLISAFATHFAPWDDGHATDRVLQSVFGVDMHANHKFQPVQEGQ